MTDHNRELSIPLSTGHAAINPGKSLRGNILYCFGLVRWKTTSPGLLNLDKAVFPVFLSPLDDVEIFSLRRPPAHGRCLKFRQ
jgi:hypothetical protein